MPENTPDDASSVQIRVTNHGKVNTFVESAMLHFQKSPNKPLTLHTMPATKQADDARQTEPTLPLVLAEEEDPAQLGKQRERMHPALSTIPRLVSIVEIVKREYLKTLDPALADQGKLSGLHQYNQIAELKEFSCTNGPGDSEEARTNALALALQGRRHLRQHKVAYMKVMLSKDELPDLVAQGFTYQPPDLRRLSKSARARLKKRQKQVSAEQPEQPPQPVHPPQPALAA